MPKTIVFAQDLPVVIVVIKRCLIGIGVYFSYPSAKGIVGKFGCVRNSFLRLLAQSACVIASHVVPLEAYIGR